MSGTKFYDAPEQQQIVKTKLVAKYFGAWARIMLSHARGTGPRIAYIDLFSGPGRFDDGKPSTPLWILRQALKNPKTLRSACHDVQ
jgi:three-Cys-motif partner protein